MPSSRLQATLKTLQVQLSALVGRPLTQAELALIADMKPRSFGEWMRGDISPASAQALLRLLSEVPVQDLMPLLKPWNEGRVEALAKGASISTSSKPSTPTQSRLKKSQQVKEK
jgi:hypothetical protein